MDVQMVANAMGATTRVLRSAIWRRTIRVICIVGAVLSLVGCSEDPTPANGLGVDDVSGTWTIHGEAVSGSIELGVDRTVRAHGWPADVFCADGLDAGRLDVTGTWIGANSGGDNAIYLMLDTPCATQLGFLFRTKDDGLELHFYPPRQLESSFKPLWVLQREE